MSARLHWALRPATAADSGFLQQVYASTRADELACTGWHAAQCDAFVAQQYRAQTTHYQAHWPDAVLSVIVAGSRVGDRAGGGAGDGSGGGTGGCTRSAGGIAAAGNTPQDVGRLWLHQRSDAIHVLDIALLAGCRGQGIGTLCLQALQCQAQHSGLALTICVEVGNPARRLYDRLGFWPVGAADGVYQRMAWRPAAAQSTRPVVAQSMETCDEQT